MATEKRLIDAIALISKARRMETTDNNGIPVDTYAVPVLAIEDAPTVDAVEVVHGRWLYDSGSGKHFCSACTENALSFRKDTLGLGEVWEVCLTDYCPNCGADMR